jgi:hypothetical protein
MKRYLDLTLAAALTFTVTACNDPQAKLESARENQAEAQVDAAETRAEALKEVSKEQAELNEAARRANEKIEDAQRDVEKANAEMTRAVIEIDKDRVEAQERHVNRLSDLSERAGKLALRPADPDPAKQHAFGLRLQTVNADLENARTQVASISAAAPAQWKEQERIAEAALDKLEQSVKDAE